MSLIQCAEKCKFQKDGYCSLEILGTVNANENGCPYYKTPSFDDSNSLFKASDSDQL